MFYFDSINEFLWMSGHGPYVWGSYALVCIGLVSLVLSAKNARKRFFKQQKQILAREGVE